MNLSLSILLFAVGLVAVILTTAAIINFIKWLIWVDGEIRLLRGNKAPRDSMEWLDKELLKTHKKLSRLYDYLDVEEHVERATEEKITVRPKQMVSITCGTGFTSNLGEAVTISGIDFEAPKPRKRTKKKKPTTKRRKKK